MRSYFLCILLLFLVLAANNNLVLVNGQSGINKALLCPAEGWVAYSTTKCFKFEMMPKGVTKLNAGQYCGPDGKLATIRSESEQNFVYQLSKNRSLPSCTVWINGERVLGSFIWTSDRSKIENTKWLPAKDLNSECIEIQIQKRDQEIYEPGLYWKNVNCNKLNWVLCEISQFLSLEYCVKEINQLRIEHTSRLDALSIEYRQEIDFQKLECSQTQALTCNRQRELSDQKRPADTNYSSKVFCPGWAQYSNMKCFKLIKEASAKYNGNEKCGPDGKLATIRSESERTFVNQLLNSSSSPDVRSYSFWIDGEVLENRSFIWKLDGTQIEHPSWITDYPEPNYTCILAFADKNDDDTFRQFWVSTVCHNLFWVLCEKTQLLSILEYSEQRIEQLEMEVSSLRIEYETKINSLHDDYETEVNSIRGSLIQCVNYKSNNNTIGVSGPRGLRDPQPCNVSQCLINFGKLLRSNLLFILLLLVFSAYR